MTLATGLELHSEPAGTQFSQNSALSVTAQVGANGKAQLICTSSRPNKRGFLTNTSSSSDVAARRGP